MINNFIEKTIADIQRVFNETFFSNEISAKKGLLQAIEPRVKLLTFLGLILAVNLSKSHPALLVLIGYIFILVAGSRVPLLPFCKRVTAAVIVFTGLVVIPALFNVVLPGDPLVLITRRFYITKQGVQGGAYIMLRSFASVGLVFLLTTTTKWANILKATRALKIPPLFVMTLEMAHRYLFLGLELASKIFTARKSRTLGASVGNDGRRFVAAAAGNLLIRTSLMGDEVYQAMVSRGYCGESKSIDRFKIRSIDWLWLVLTLVLLEP